MKELITIIAPMYNEEDVVEEYCLETMKVLDTVRESFDYEILLINDGSRDNTIQQMSYMQKKFGDVIGIVNLTRNFGLEGAISAGLKTAAGDIIIVMDADLQDPPSLILEMLNKYKDGADVVIARRKKRSNDNFFKRASAGLFYKILDSFSGKLKLERNAANYRLLSRKALEKILELPEVNGVFRVLVPFIGMKTDIVEYDRNKRFAGKTKYNFASMLRYALDSITGISVEPLRKIIWTLPLTALIALVSVVGMIIASGYWKAAFMVTFMASLLFGLLFIVISLIGEYIAQVMIEVKHRPTSMIYEYKPSANAERRLLK